MSGDQNFRGNTATDNAWQHNGNIHNNNTHNEQRSQRKPPSDGSYQRGLLDAAQHGHTKRIERYLNYDIDLDFKDIDGRTALHWAAKNGHESVARTLIEAHCNIDSSSAEHGTPLCEAAQAGKASVVKLLLDAGADVNASGGWHGSAIHAACMSDSLETLVLLLDAGAGVNTICTRTTRTKNELRLSKGSRFDRTKSTPLFLAVSSGSVDLVRNLLSYGADVDALSRKWHARYQHTSYEDIIDSKWEVFPIHKAASHPSTAILKMLLDKGVDVNSKASDGRTPLHYAAQDGPSGSLGLLLDKGCDIHSVDALQQTALFYASTRLCVELLVRRGARLCVRNKNDDTPLLVHAANGRHASAEALLDLGVPVDDTKKDGRTALFFAATRQCVELLVQRGAQIGVKTTSGYTPLIDHAFNGRHASVEALLDLGVPLDATNYEEKTALCYASTRQCIELLIGRGAKISSRNRYGKTALMYHALSGRQASVEALLDLGASINDRDNCDDTALDLARFHGQKGIVRLLKQQGGKSGHMFGGYLEALKTTISQ